MILPSVRSRLAALTTIIALLFFVQPALAGTYLLDQFVAQPGASLVAYSTSDKCFVITTYVKAAERAVAGSAEQRIAVDDQFGFSGGIDTTGLILNVRGQQFDSCAVLRGTLGATRVVAVLDYTAATVAYIKVEALLSEQQLIGESAGAATLTEFMNGQRIFEVNAGGGPALLLLNFVRRSYLLCDIQTGEPISDLAIDSSLQGMSAVDFRDFTLLAVNFDCSAWIVQARSDGSIYRCHGGTQRQYLGLRIGPGNAMLIDCVCWTAAALYLIGGKTTFEFKPAANSVIFNSRESGYTKARLLELDGAKYIVYFEPGEDMVQRPISVDLIIE